jgi:hypothetical protein
MTTNQARKSTWTYSEITSAIEQQLRHVVEESRNLDPIMAAQMLHGHGAGILNGWLAITDGEYVEADKERLRLLVRSIGESSED